MRELELRGLLLVLLMVVRHLLELVLLRILAWVLMLLERGGPAPGVRAHLVSTCLVSRVTRV